MNDLTLLLIFITNHFLSLSIRTFSYKYLKNEYRNGLKFGSLVDLNNYKYKVRRGIILRKISNFLRYIGTVIIFIIFILMKKDLI